ncbi:MAG: 2-oxoglutarate and iron-dependent oxygenase domain-containing protein [Pigmentiphaga sp.]|uniref:isopenicillin N synthase family dioxygenase n=1 Tax=Pigmentiphaga sp. TaxID=1977564 RepID=UPI0029A61B39|nr:2-oxoglutarate and iron-dependent oxygenase domain-containing protein [Pigmentiphaga sp.]MDX3904645.1 2-oxoglutarate and iron-dependent oxygenase domain-containing protein [Pigmentiphaga sp.]
MDALDASARSEEEERYLMDHPDSDEEIPVVDIADYLAGRPGARERAAAQLRDASENVGFLYLTGHGVDPVLFPRMFDAAARFHALPLAIKQAIALNEHNAGYLGMSETLSAVSSIIKHKPNRNAAFLMNRERSPDDPEVQAGTRFHGLNQWPDESAIPGFRATLLEYYAAMESLARHMMPLWAVALGLPPGFFDAAFEKPHIIMRVSHYPPHPDRQEGQYGLAPHTDNSLMTLLAQANVPGLAVRMPSGHWRLAPLTPGALIVNTGNLMVRWTNGRFLSTKHRVINTGDTDRYAFPVFVGPNASTVIRTLPTCLDKTGGTEYPPVRYQELLEWYFQKGNR